ncbi:hypothetical protein ES708_21584 [subsurface metagenome]
MPFEVVSHDLRMLPYLNVGLENEGWFVWVSDSVGKFDLWAKILSFGKVRFC